MSNSAQAFLHGSLKCMIVYRGTLSIYRYIFFFFFVIGLKHILCVLIFVICVQIW